MGCGVCCPKGQGLDFSWTAGSEGPGAMSRLPFCESQVPFPTARAFLAYRAAARFRRLVEIKIAQDETGLLLVAL